MENNIFSRLTYTSLKVVEDLQEKGWVFEDASWESGHNGTPYDDVRFKSPNMGKAASIGEWDWPKVTMKYLLDREAHHAAHDWAETVFHYASVITNPVADGLKAYFADKNTAKFKNLQATDAVFSIKVSPKIKDGKPKKIKVTVEIV